MFGCFSRYWLGTMMSSSGVVRSSFPASLKSQYGPMWLPWSDTNIVIVFDKCFFSFILRRNALRSLSASRTISEGEELLDRSLTR